MNPGAAVLLILGYGLLLPIGARIGQLSIQRLRLGVIGMQAGFIVAACGWLLRNSPVMAAIHLGGAVGARLYLRWRTNKLA